MRKTKNETQTPSDFTIRSNIVCSDGDKYINCSDGDRYANLELKESKESFISLLKNTNLDYNDYGTSQMSYSNDRRGASLNFIDRNNGALNFNEYIANGCNYNAGVNGYSANGSNAGVNGYSANGGNAGVNGYSTNGGNQVLNTVMNTVIDADINRNVVSEGLQVYLNNSECRAAPGTGDCNLLDNTTLDNIGGLETEKLILKSIKRFYDVLNVSYKSLEEFKDIIKKIKKQIYDMTERSFCLANRQAFAQCETLYRQNFYSRGSVSFYKNKYDGILEQYSADIEPVKNFARIPTERDRKEKADENK